jgi:hypothetical protein
VVDPGSDPDPRETANLEAPTEYVRPAVPTDPVPAEAPAEPIGRHRRGPGIWLPAGVFAVLLVAAVAVGRFVIPQKVAGQNAAQPTPIATGQPTASEPEPGQVLPTTPGRPADQLAVWAARVGSALNVPDVAMQAYGYAQYVLEQSDPSCHLSWSTLAGVGEVESHHGQAGGAVLEPTGRSSPAIVGPSLDGQQGRALVRDTDAGAYDGDATYDRAMGPLRLMPAIWSAYAVDADGDGILDPYDLDDSALALGQLLCSGVEDLRKASDWNAAIARYRPGTAYARSVFTVADQYGQRSRSVS